MFLQIFKLLTAFLLLTNCSLWSAYSLALNLGEIKLDSALGQPLRATIQIVDHAIDSNSFTADLYRGDNLGNTSSEDDLYLNSLSFRFADDDEGGIQALAGLRHALCDGNTWADHPAVYLFGAAGRSYLQRVPAVSVKCRCLRARLCFDRRPVRWRDNSGPVASHCLRDLYVRHSHVETLERPTDGNR